MIRDGTRRRRLGRLGRSALRLASIGALLGAAACQTYEAKPLSPEAVAQELTPPAASTLRLEASRIRHPSLAPIALDLDDGLSPDEAAVLAVLLNPALRAARAQRAVAGAQLLQAGILPNPSLDAGFDVPISGPDPFTAYGFGLSWDFTDLLDRSARESAAEATARSVDLDIAWQEWQQAQEARLATYDLAALEQQRDLASRQVDQLEASLETNRRAFEAREVTELNVQAAEAAHLQAIATMRDLEAQIRAQRQALLATVGFPPDADVKLEPVDFTKPAGALPDLDTLTSGIEERRLDLLALRSGYESQEETLRAAVIRQFPRITLGPRYGRDTSDVVTMGFGLSIDLPIFDQNQGRIAAERATREVLFHEYTQRVFEARAEIARAREEIRSLRAEIETAEALEKSQERLVAVYHAALERNQADVVTYYNAVVDGLQKQIDLAALRARLVAARVALSLATGSYQLAPAERGERENAEP